LDFIASLVRQMDATEGDANPFFQPCLSRLSYAIFQWVAKMKSERYSENSIDLHRRKVERHLKTDSNPTKLGLQAHFAKRLEDRLSPAAVENERKR
jgi:hypothetical protein